MINYKEALSRIAINLEDDKPLNTNWVLRSAQSSMRSTMYSVQQSRFGENQTPKIVSHSRVGSSNIKLLNEFDAPNENKLNFSSDQKIDEVPYPNDILKSKTPMNSKLSSRRGRVTPASNLPVKLVNQHMKTKHESEFNIITNRDKSKNKQEPTFEEGDKMISQAMADYQDFSKCNSLILTSFSKIRSTKAQSPKIGNTMTAIGSLKKSVT